MTDEIKPLEETIDINIVQRKLGEYLQKVYGQEVVYCVIMVPSGGDIPLTKILSNTTYEAVPPWLDAAARVSKEYVENYKSKAGEKNE